MAARANAPSGTPVPGEGKSPGTAENPASPLAFTLTAEPQQVRVGGSIEVTS